MSLILNTDSGGRGRQILEFEASLIYSESQDTQGYTDKPCLEKSKEKQMIKKLYFL